MSPTVALPGSMTRMAIRLSSGTRCPQSPKALPRHCSIILSVIIFLPSSFLTPSSRGILSPSPLLALLYDFAQIHNRPYLNRSKSILEARLLGDKLNRMIEVSRLKDLNSAKLFLGFRIGAVRGRDFAVFPVQGQRGLRRLKR